MMERNGEKKKGEDPIRRGCPEWFVGGEETKKWGKQNLRETLRRMIILEGEEGGK